MAFKHIKLNESVWKTLFGNNSCYFELLFGALMEASLPIRPVPLGLLPNHWPQENPPGDGVLFMTNVITYLSMYVTVNFYAISSQWLGAVG